MAELFGSLGSEQKCHTRLSTNASCRASSTPINDRGWASAPVSASRKITLGPEFATELTKHRTAGQRVHRGKKCAVARVRETIAGSCQGVAFEGRCSDALTVGTRTVSAPDSTQQSKATALSKLSPSSSISSARDNRTEIREAVR